MRDKAANTPSCHARRRNPPGAGHAAVRPPRHNHHLPTHRTSCRSTTCTDPAEAYQRFANHRACNVRLTTEARMLSSISKGILR